MSNAASDINEPQGAGAAIAAQSGRGRILRWLLFAFTIWFFIPYYLTCLYIFVDPPLTAFMLGDAFGGRRINYRWRDLEQIAPNLIIQVIASEDGRFCEHWGVDWSAIDKAVDAIAEGRPRGGGSTIPMQTAKNLFFWNRPAFLRKPFEILLSYYMDLVLGKERLIEIYLNVVEWGPGLYGAEAAAQRYFGKSAALLSTQEAAQLAAALPNPKRRNAGRPGPRTFALASRLRARALREREAAHCVLAGRSGEGVFDW